MRLQSISTPEFDVLRYAVRRGLVEDEDLSTQSITNVDSNHLIRISQHASLAVITYQYLSRQNITQAWFQRDLKRVAMSHLMKQSRINQALVSIAHAFENDTINFVCFKGVAAAKQLYPNSVFRYRVGSDIDLLVEACDYPKAIRALAALGYDCIDHDRPEELAEFVEHHASWLTKRGLVYKHSETGISIDLHWRALNDFLLPISTTEILRHKVHIEFEGIQLPTPSFTEHLLLLVMHGFQDSHWQLRQLADVYYGVAHPDSDVSALEQLASTYGVEKHLQSVLHLCDVIFNGSPVEQGSYAENVINRFIKSNDMPTRIHNNTGYWSLWDKWRYLLYQSKTRSKKSSLFAPLLNRLLYSFAMVPSHKVKPARYLCFAWIKRLL